MFFGTRTFCLLGNKNFLFFGTRTFLAFPYCLSFVVVILWQQDLSFLWHKNFLFFGTRTFRAARINLSCVPCFFGNRTFRFLSTRTSPYLYNPARPSLANRSGLLWEVFAQVPCNCQGHVCQDGLCMFCILLCCLARVPPSFKRVPCRV